MENTAFESWAVLELMGHRVRPGYCQEVEIAGGKMMRIDIPVSDTDSVTEYYGATAIYAIRPATEEIVREKAYKRYGEDIRPIRPVDYRPQLEQSSEAAERAADEYDFG